MSSVDGNVNNWSRHSDNATTSCASQSDTIASCEDLILQGRNTCKKRS